MPWFEEIEASLGCSNFLSSSISAALKIRPDHGSLVTSADLIIASDWSGLQNGALFEVASHLIVGWDAIPLWDQARSVSRSLFAADGRRMAFKSLGDKQRLDQLPSFVASADLLSGVLLTIAFDKQISSMFQASDPKLSQFLNSPLASWHTKTAERGMRAFHTLGLLLRGLSKPGQNVFWLADQDDIFANEVRHAEAVEACGIVLSHYLKHSLGHLRVGTTKSDTGRRDVEDLVSIADLAAGAVQSLMQGAAGALSQPNVFHERPSGTPNKTKLVLDWLSDPRGELSKIILVVHEKNGRLISSTLHLPGQEVSG